MELKGVTAIVTGSTGQVGSSITLALGQAGCKCVCHYKKNGERAKELVRQIEQGGSKAIAVQADLSKPEGIEKLFEGAAKLGIAKILINSAAIFGRTKLHEIDFAAAEEFLHLNLIAPILTSKAFVERQKFETGEAVVGKIINIADVGGLRPWKQYSLYCASKAGVISVTKSLAKELAPTVTVNAIAPGIVTWPEDFNEEHKQRQLRMVPLKRNAQPQEIAEGVLFLLKNDYVTGHVLKIDGGRCI